MSLLHRPTAIVIAERNSAWTSWVERLRAEDFDVSMIMQLEGESVSELASRVRRRVAALDPEERIARAVIVSGGRTDAAAISARSLTIRALVAPMVAAGEGDIVLASSRRDRISMLGLATTVAPMIRGTGVAIRPAVADSHVQVARVA